MSNELVISAIETALIKNDLSKLNDQERLTYYRQVCDSLGLNYLTQPFGYIALSGKLTLYAKRDAADQLRRIHRVSIVDIKREKTEDIYIVSVKVRDSDGREDESMGALDLKGLTGEKLANALMKCETKAKRRATLSICGLGFLDESEIHSISDAREVPMTQIEAPKINTEAPPPDMSSLRALADQINDEKLRDAALTFLANAVTEEKIQAYIKRVKNIINTQGKS